MNNDKIENDVVFVCSECELEITNEDELFLYDGMNVCADCYDKLKLTDEQEVQDWETEGYDYD
jgi:hypothetical protein